MKNTLLLHGEISRLIALTGHTQSITIADVGLPVAPGQPCIDLALSRNIPRFIDAVTALCSEFCLERAVIAEEMGQKNPQVHAQLTALLQAYGQKHALTVPVQAYPHETFKRFSQASNAVIRTGECSPFANVILYAGVNF